MKNILKKKRTLFLKFTKQGHQARLLLLLFFTTISLASFPQDTHIRFGRITINDGLSMSSVYCIFQDSKGFMWFGTEDGLNKFDGNSFTIYRAGPYDKNSISHKWTEIVYEDVSGILWLGSRGGLTRFDPAIENFQQFIHDADDLNSLANDTVSAISESANGQLWIGTLGGLNLIDPEEGTIRRIGTIDNLPDGMTARINILERSSTTRQRSLAA